MTKTMAKQPEADEARDVRVSRADGPRRDEEQPRAERDEMEDADDLVDRRVVDVLLVALVEPVELGGDDPRRQSPGRAPRLQQRIRPLAARDDQLREQVREEQAGNVGGEERARRTSRGGAERRIGPRPLARRPALRERDRALAAAPSRDRAPSSPQARPCVCATPRQRAVWA